MRPLYQILFSTFEAWDNCQRSGNIEWQNKHEDRLELLISNHLPSGSGWDSGTKANWNAWKRKPETMVFYGGFHHMNDDGMYDGWTDHTITIKPSFSGITIQISGPNRNDIKEHIHSLFYEALTEQRDEWEYPSA